MKIFEQEIRDGLEHSIAQQTSIAFQNVVKTSKSPKLELRKELKTIANANKDQVDLHYLHTVLVSTGWNKNDDVFLPDQTWAARNSPEDKQFNFMHDEDDIIGHITGSYVIDSEGQHIDNDTVTPPTDFDIITESVIYKAWSKEANRERIKKLIAEINEGKWFVSMECIFPSFNYAVVTPEGKNYLLPRNESSAYLTKHLRAYGGQGEYEGYRVGRALSDLSFSGKGLVSEPANPRSIILKSKAFSLKEKDFTENFLIGEKTMADVNNDKTISRLEADLAEAKQKAEAAEQKAAEKTQAEIDQLTKERDEAIASEAEAKEAMDKKKKMMDDEMAKSKSELEEVQAKLAKSEEENTAMKKKMMEAKRKAKLVKAGFSNEEAEDAVATYSEMSDENFEAAMVTMANIFEEKKKALKKTDENDSTKINEAKKTKAKDYVEEEEVEPTKGKKKGKAEDESAEASAETFEEAKAESIISGGEEQDETEKTIAAVSNWFEESLFKNINKVNK